jgi:predicted ABC-type ATPase
MMCLPTHFKKRSQSESGHSLAEAVTAISLLNLIVLIAMNALIGSARSDGHEGVFDAVQIAADEITLCIKNNRFIEFEKRLSKDFILKMEIKTETGYNELHWHIKSSKRDYTFFSFYYIPPAEVPASGH